MILNRYKPASLFSVREWIEDSIPDLTVYQKERIRYDEMVSNSPFDWYEERQREKVKLIWRFSIIVYFIVIIILLLLIPINFLITGRWGYSYKKLKFIYDWSKKLGF